MTLVNKLTEKAKFGVNELDAEKAFPRSALDYNGAMNAALILVILEFLDKKFPEEYKHSLYN